MKEVILLKKCCINRLHTFHSTPCPLAESKQQNDEDIDRKVKEREFRPRTNCRTKHLIEPAPLEPYNMITKTVKLIKTLFQKCCNQTFSCNGALQK